MQIYTYVPAGYTGHVVRVEVDIRRGIPGTDIVGLAGSAVREARERVRVAVRRAGLHYPRDRIVVNLSPAGVPKSGAGLDLAIAVAILDASGQVSGRRSLLVLGELLLNGSIRPVPGVLAAVSEGAERGICSFLVPAQNAAEALVLTRGQVLAVGTLLEAVRLIDKGSRAQVLAQKGRVPEAVSAPSEEPGTPDFGQFRGAPMIVRAMEIAAAGRHNLCLVGPPGSGKTMSARTLPSILPPLTVEESVEATRVHSLAGVLAPGVSLLRQPPYRSPHHSSSTEGMIGGGAIPRPGEVSLAHRGVLFLDEALQFRTPVLQSLREPMESGRVLLARATGNYWFPSDFQLVLATNPCPCGSLGRAGRICLCSQAEIARYWRRLGGPILDRIELRVAAGTGGRPILTGERGESSASIRSRVLAAVGRQAARYRDRPYDRNGRVPAHEVVEACDSAVLEQLAEISGRLGLSNRAQHSVLRVARTIADLEGSDRIGRYHLLEAVQHRRLGERTGNPADELPLSGEWEGGAG